MLLYSAYYNLVSYVRQKYFKAANVTDLQVTMDIDQTLMTPQDDEDVTRPALHKCTAPAARSVLVEMNQALQKYTACVSMF